jgi:hypothetical protein
MLIIAFSPNPVRLTFNPSTLFLWDSLSFLPPGKQANFRLLLTDSCLLLTAYCYLLCLPSGHLFHQIL